MLCGAANSLPHQVGPDSSRKSPRTQCYKPSKQEVRRATKCSPEKVLPGYSNPIKDIIIQGITGLPNKNRYPRYMSVMMYPCR